MNLNPLCLWLALLPLLMGCLASSNANLTPKRNKQESLILFDEARTRPIELALYFPEMATLCASTVACPVALISAGYRVPHTHYSFVAHALTEQGYLVVAVQHELPTDAPLAKTGDLFKERTPVWQRGAENLRYTRKALQQRYPEYDWTNLALIGHSNGGDISAQLLQDSPDFATTLITLDHRRMPLPRYKPLRILSIRATDFEADAGVLPKLSEQNDLNLCISTMAEAKHNDMQDSGPQDLKEGILSRITSFIKDKRCPP